MVDTQKLEKIMRLLDGMKPLSPDAKLSIRGYPLRLLELLFVIANHEDENQSFYAQYLGWTPANVNVHTQTLRDYGYVYFEDDVRDVRRQAKILKLTQEAKEVIEQLILKIGE